LYTYLHLTFGAILAFLLYLFGVTNNTVLLVLYVLGNIIIDLDHLITIFVWREEPYNTLRSSLLQKNFKKFVQHLREHHKDINRLLLHNYIIFIAITIMYCSTKSIPYINWLLLGVLTHMAIDQIDDIYVVGHLKNWFWFAKKHFNSKFKKSLILTITIIITLYVTLILNK